MKLQRFGRLVLCSLTLSFAIISCTPEKRALLRTTATSFADQSISALELTQVISENEQKIPVQSSKKAKQDSINIFIYKTGSDYNWKNLKAIEEDLLEASNNENKPSEMGKEINAIKEEYRTAALLYKELENVDYDSPRLVDEAKASVRRLTLKIYGLGKYILEFPPGHLRYQKYPLQLELAKIDREYHEIDQEYSNSKTSQKRKAEIEKRKVEIKQEIDEIADKWLSIKKEEKKILCDAVIQTQKATATGVTLSQLSDDYGKVDLDIIFSRLNEFLGIASNLTGKNYGSVNAKSTQIEEMINKDTAMKKVIISILNASPSNFQNTVSEQRQVLDFLKINSKLDCTTLGGN